MSWVYKEVPAALLLPACPHCRNRGHVTMILRGVFLCGDCNPPRPFVAVWVADERPAALPSKGRRAG